MSETYCEVSLGDYDGDEAAFCQEREVTGRKQHVCYECSDIIEKGARHHVVAGKWDDEVRTYRFCAPCWEVISEFSEHGRTFGVVWDTFEDDHCASERAHDAPVEENQGIEVADGP